jgi:ABC-type nitrate/sulfonate/bicarbonate transport system ATPase subunit
VNQNNKQNLFFYCRNITRYYEGEPVIQGIDLDLNEGGIISLVGASGVGKTTLFNILAGVDNPDEGRIFLNDTEITGIVGKVSYMMQKDLLLEYRTVLGNVILPLLVRGVPRREAEKTALPFFERFGLAGYEKKYPRQLSGGMRQRAALLRTFLQNTPVILLDEPFSALDALTRRGMQDWFQNIIKTTIASPSVVQPSELSGAEPRPPGSAEYTAIFITHDVEEAIFLSDRVHVLGGSPGRITAVFEVNAPRPRDRDFSLTEEFALLKKEILEQITVSNEQ